MWDNYSKLVDSIIAHAQATHDTMAIVCQNKKPNGAASALELAFMNTDGPPPTKRRQSYTEKGEDQVAPYMKNHKTSKFNFKSYEAVIPGSFEEAKDLDNLWLFMSLLRAPTPPMWRGWNSVSIVDNLPPTRLDIVQETIVV